MNKLILLSFSFFISTQIMAQPCRTQDDCGGPNSFQFCNYVADYSNPDLKSQGRAGNDGDNRMPRPNACQQVDYHQITIDGLIYYYNTERALKSWCREATQGAPEDTPGNCNWGYLSYEGAQNWCAAVGGRLLTKDEIDPIWATLRKANIPLGQTPCYWTSTEGALWGVYNKMAYWCYGDHGADGKGGDARKDGYSGAGGVICLIGGR